MLVDGFTEILKVNEAIDGLLSKLETQDPTDDAYARLVDQLTKLTKIKQTIVETKLKDFASQEEARQFNANNALKNRELEAKDRESDSNLNLKLREFDQRLVEHDENFALRKREIDLKQADAEKPDQVSKDALVAAGASILGIALIINYERLNVIASKALGFVLKR